MFSHRMHSLSREHILQENEARVPPRQHHSFRGREGGREGGREREREIDHSFVGSGNESVFIQSL